MSSPAIVYTSSYNFGLRGMERLHPFDLHKYAHAMRLLLANKTIDRRQVVPPVWPSDELLKLVHTGSYLRSLRASATMAKIAEVPLIGKLPSALTRWLLLTPMRWAVGGTLVAAREALRQGSAINLGGGFHHAHRNRGHGFCALSDVGVAIEALRQEDLARRFLIVDLDAHQGDGHEMIFMDDDDVRILDMYNSYVFPQDQQARDGIRWEVRLRSGTSDREYLRQLREVLPSALDETMPDLAFYLAGTDILAGDPLGLLDVSHAGVLERDAIVWQKLTSRGIPTVMLTAGGYTKSSAPLIAESIARIVRGS